MAVFNFVLYICLSILWLFKSKSHFTAVSCIGYYCMIALCCAIQYEITPDSWNLSLRAFAYLFAIMLILFYPLWNQNFHITPEQEITIANFKTFKIILCVFIAAAFISMFYGWGDAIVAFRRGDWLAVRTDMYQAAVHGEASYSNQLERRALHIIMFCRVFAMVAYFYILCDRTKKFSKTFKILLLIAIIGPVIMGGLKYAARGSLFNFLIRFGLIYALFYKSIPKSTKKLLNVFLLSFCILALLLVLSITVARFDDEANSSILSYFGQSMLYFNSDIFPKVHTTLEGRRFLGVFFPFDSGPINTGSTAGTAFYTLVGDLFLDFGFWGTLLFAIILAAIIKSVLRHKHNSFGVIFIFIYYISFLCEGVFAFGTGYGLEVLFSFVLYHLVQTKIKWHKNHKSITT